jgi:hypothetical protein
MRQITTNFLDHVDTNRPYRRWDLPRLRLAIKGLVMTENREVTGSTPVGATVPFRGFYSERDFLLPSEMPVLGRSDCN